MAFSKGSVIRYTLLPGIVPRLINLFTSGFGYAAYLMAIICAGVRLLPLSHPYLDPVHTGQFGIRHVMAEASRNLRFSWKHVDQIIIYFTILAGLILLMTQIALMGIALVAERPAAAQLFTVQEVMGVDSSFGHDGDESQDLVFGVMDRVFGTEGIFNSCVSTGSGCVDLEGNPLPTPAVYPFRVHNGFHALLEFYSRGIFFVSILFLLYLVATLVGETAVSGSPFGRRANKTWFPVRLILFFALLMPLNIGGDRNAGLNAAQLITLWTAKIGSNFATNGWGLFNDTMNEQYLGDVKKLVATPNVPEMGELVRFMFVAKTCRISEGIHYNYDAVGTGAGVQAYVVRGAQIAPIVPGDNAVLMETLNFRQAFEFANRGTISIRFGVQGDPDDNKYKTFKGYVDPVCGQVEITPVRGDISVTNLGTADVQELYYNMIREMWSRDADMTQAAMCVVGKTDQNALLYGLSCLPSMEPDVDFARNRIGVYEDQMRTNLSAFIDKQVAGGEWDVPEQLKKKGWGGAAIWFNRVAEMNGDLTSSILAVPQPSQYPAVMETVLKQKTMNNQSLDRGTLFDPRLPDGLYVKFDRNEAEDRVIASSLNKAYVLWDQDDLYSVEPTGNIFIDTINLLYGTNGIFEMRKNTDIHPLAQLTSLGKGLIEASIRNIGLGAPGGQLAKLFKGVPGADVAKTAGNFLYEIGLSTLVLGMVLFYVVPFMPFIYFMFSVMTWVKTIFEAIVAMPLWALAHVIHLDGDGIPGPGATNGYFLLFEIFLRPILTIVGLLGSISIFAAMVSVLNDIFDLAVANTSGFDFEAENAAIGESLIDYARNPVDEFFFTAVYTVVCYMIAIGTFKLIDGVPNQILRFMNFTVQAFQGLEGQNAALGTLSTVHKGGLVATGEAKGGALAAIIAV